MYHAVIYGLTVVVLGMNGCGYDYINLATVQRLNSTTKLRRYERSRRAGSSMFPKCRIRGPDPRGRPAGRQKSTRGSKWPDPQRDPHLAGHDPTRPARFFNTTSPDPIHEIGKGWGSSGGIHSLGFYSHSEV